ncbi:TIGR00645 family protein [Alphaproteobacteria bacterium]|jgi:uncharacterized protein (TIGR00645 family)|nr:TIGR00645 family protein [Alphaproteobacteria bacterium]
MRKPIESALERMIFASRWFMAPVYLILCFSLGIIMLKVIQEILHAVPNLISMSIKDTLLLVLHLVDLALIGNLVLMIIFAGYENFVSRIEVARDSEDKPNWMGKVDFSGLKLKLIASIVAISGVNLLETFMDVASRSDRDLYWMVTLHVVFVGSGVVLALMDYVASKSQSH